MWQVAKVHYLACFGLVPYSFFGLFLSSYYVVHWFGYILLYVVYYVTLKRGFPSESMMQAARNMRLYLSVCTYIQWLTDQHVFDSSVKSAVMSTLMLYLHIVLNALMLIHQRWVMRWRWQRQRRGRGDMKKAWSWKKRKHKTDADWQSEHHTGSKWSKQEKRVEYSQGKS